MTEIESDGFKVFVDIGANLPGNDTPLPDIEGLTGGDCSTSALFLTHYHADHVGLLDRVSSHVPVYIGKTASEILRTFTERIGGCTKRINSIRAFQPFEQIGIGPLTITPLMIDHSAFDSYMFLIDTGSCRILHTGDFRLHGFRGHKTLALLRRYAREVDYLICDGTLLSRSSEPLLSERALRQQARAIMRDNPYVFVLCASTNIDRIAAFYHARPHGRLFVCDAYQKQQLKIVNRYHAHKSSLYEFNHVYSYASNLDQPMQRHGFCMLVRQGEQFQRIINRYQSRSVFIYSMWNGYLKGQTRIESLADFVLPHNPVRLHSSGHAPMSDLRALYDTIKPKSGLIPIHTEEPELFRTVIPHGSIHVLDDGEPMRLSGWKGCSNGKNRSASTG